MLWEILLCIFKSGDASTFIIRIYLIKLDIKIWFQSIQRLYFYPKDYLFLYRDRVTTGRDINVTIMYKEKTYPRNDLVIICTSCVISDYLTDVM